MLAAVEKTERKGCWAGCSEFLDAALFASVGGVPGLKLMTCSTDVRGGGLSPVCHPQEPKRAESTGTGGDWQVGINGKDGGS